ncbi:ParB N-terminal domain-containing protein [Sinomonas atrocyanea]|uniref:ParB N-terminal domain-containing protein n=1 Tax=Sinomonas atrocyanea TaxID=37927 RepID=UPI003D99F268
MPTVELPIARLARDSIERSRSHLDPKRVTYYVEHFDDVVPVVVFDIDGVLLLADGHHRLAAAEQLGRTTVKADLRKGQRADALQFAIDLARRQRGLTEHEVLEAMSRRGRPVQRP